MLLRRNHKLIMLLMAWIMAASCGVEVGNPKNPDDDDDQPAKSVLEEDPAAAAGLVSLKLDDTVDTLSSTEQQREGLSLTGSFAATDFDASVTCDDETADQVVVARTAEGDLTFRRRSPDGFYKIVVEGEVSLTNTWQGDDEFIRCNNAGRRAQIGFRNLDELSLTAEFSKDETTTVSRLVLGTQVRQHTVVAEGERSYSWERTDASEDGVASVAGIIKTTAERTLTITTARSGTTEISTSLATDADDPISTIADYDTDTGLLVQKTIKSGTQVGIQRDGTKIVSTYKDVVLVREEGCQPQSGTVTGEIFASEDEEEPFATYTVTFSGADATIEFDSGETETYAADACVFER